MKLRHAPFESIRTGKKYVELRLYDEKRRTIQADDTIVFTDVDTLQTVVCKVLHMRTFPTFHDLYRHYDKTAIGYGENEPSDPNDMLSY